MRNETFDTPRASGLRVNLPSGDIRFETSAEATETYVELSGPNEDEARIEQRRNEIVIEIEKKKLFGFKGDHIVLVTAPVRHAGRRAHGLGRRRRRTGRFGDVERRLGLGRRVLRGRRRAASR